MTDKPSAGAEYREHDLALVRKACLYLATKIGDVMEDIVVVGGLVPSLIIDQSRTQEGALSYPSFQRHIGTKDLDLALATAILDEERYRVLTERLRRANLVPDANSQDNLTRQRWRMVDSDSLTVDFLIQPIGEVDRGGVLHNIEPDFAAVVTPGLHLAFLDRRKVTVSGYTITGEWAQRDIWVCGPGAFLVLKAMAFRNRGENKDAYDLIYVLNTAMSDVSLKAELVSFLSDHRMDADVQRALAFVREDFSGHDGLGPRRTAVFLSGEPDDNIQADVIGIVTSLLNLVPED